MSVRIYAGQPLMSYHRWDSGAIVSTYPIGRSSAAFTQHETTIDSALVLFIEQRFINLWSPEVSTSLDDYLGLPLLIYARANDSLNLTVRYVQVDDSVYVADPAMAHLVNTSGPDSVVTQVTGSGHHPLLTVGRCRVLLCPDEAPRIRALFAQKYGLEDECSVLRLSPLRRQA
jgi:hypothetical protein